LEEIVASIVGTMIASGLVKVAQLITKSVECSMYQGEIKEKIQQMQNKFMTLPKTYASINRNLTKDGHSKLISGRKRAELVKSGEDYIEGYRKLGEIKLDFIHYAKSCMKKPSEKAKLQSALEQFDVVVEPFIDFDAWAKKMAMSPELYCQHLPPKMRKTMNKVWRFIGNRIQENDPEYLDMVNRYSSAFKFIHDAGRPYNF